VPVNQLFNNSELQNQLVVNSNQLTIFDL